MPKESFERTMPKTKAPRIEPAETPSDRYVRGLIASQLLAVALDSRRPAPDNAEKITKKTFGERLGRIEECFGWSGNILPPTFCYLDRSGRTVMVVSWDQARATQPEDRPALLASLQQIETERLIASLVFGLRYITWMIIYRNCDLLYY